MLRKGPATDTYFYPDKIIYDNCKDFNINAAS